MRKGRSGTGSIWRWIAALALGFAIGASHAQTSWKPERGVEIIVGTSPGGGQDTSARFVQKVLRTRTVETPTVVVNKPGGGSPWATPISIAHRRRPFHLMLTVPLITNHILGLSQISHADLSPLAVLFDEYIVAAVAPQSPIGSAKELMRGCRRIPPR